MQITTMQITRRLETNPGPGDWFTGGARTAWHVSDEECAPAPSLEAGGR
jgi:hypothetical protein